MPSAIQQSKYSDNVREEPNENEQQTLAKGLVWSMNWES